MIVNQDIEFKSNILTGKCDSIADLDDVLMKQNGLYILHVNIRSLNKNFDELKLAINSMFKKPDIIICTETHKIVLPSMYELQNYDLHFVDSEINKCDGTCLYVSRNISHKNTVISIGKIKSLFTELTIGQEKIYLTSLYRSHCITIEHFIRDLYVHLNENKNRENHFILGDLNINILHENHKTNEYVNNLLEFGYQSLINIPTREVRDQISCIDHIFGKFKNTLKPQPIVYDINLTDHYATLLLIDLNTEEVKNEKREQFIETINENKLIKLISKENWTDIYNETNIDNAVKKFIDKINIYMSEATTIRKKPKKLKARKDWMTTALIHSCKIKDKLYRQFKKDPNNLALREKYVRYKNMLKQLMKTAKINYYDVFLKDVGCDSKKLWYFLKNNIISKKKCNVEIEKLMSKSDETLLTDTKDIVTEFNNFFATVGLEMAKAFDHNQAVTPDENSTVLPNSIFFSPASELEIQTIIANMKSGKTGGIDKISIKIIKRIAVHILKPLAFILNRCIEDAFFPTYFKKAEIIPIFKSGSKEKSTNYRPISLISNFAKIFEKVLKQRIVSFLDKYNIINTMQFGFQAGKNTDDAIKTVVDEIHNAISNTQPCIAIFLDLAKAFDTVNHNILLKKLYAVGFRGKSYNLIESYLSGRTQVVKIRDTVSTEEMVQCGVPQGTILGPILFILYINDLLKLLNRDKIVSFADDTVIITREKTWESAIHNAENNLKKVATWLHRNHLTLNSSKTVFLTFGSYKNSLPKNATIKIHNDACSRVNCTCVEIARAEITKYLGLYIDENLNWNAHIQKTIKKTRYLIFLFYKLKTILKTSQLLTIYYALFWSVATYGIIAWGGTYVKSINPLMCIQKKILKSIFNKSLLYPTEKLYIESSILSVRKYFIEKSLLQNFEKLQDLYLKMKNSNHRINLLLPPKVNKEIDRRRYEYIAYKCFNLLPINVKNLNFQKVKTKTTIRSWLIILPAETINNMFHPEQ